MNIQDTVCIIQAAHDRTLEALKKALALNMKLGVINKAEADAQDKMKRGDFFLINMEYLTAYVTYLTENHTDEILPDELLAICPSTPSEVCLDAMAYAIKESPVLANANPDEVRKLYESTEASYEHMHLALATEIEFYLSPDGAMEEDEN